MNQLQEKNILMQWAWNKWKNRVPLQSYLTLTELEKSFSKVYRMSMDRRLTKLVAIQKSDESQERNDKRCIILTDVMDKVIRRTH